MTRGVIFQRGHYLMLHRLVKVTNCRENMFFSVSFTTKKEIMNLIDVTIHYSSSINDDKGACKKLSTLCILQTSAIMCFKNVFLTFLLWSVIMGIGQFVNGQLQGKPFKFLILVEHCPIYRFIAGMLLIFITLK